MHGQQNKTKSSFIRYGIKINNRTQVYEITLYTPYTSHMFRPRIWPSSGCASQRRTDTSSGRSM